MGTETAIRGGRDLYSKAQKLVKFRLRPDWRASSSLYEEAAAQLKECDQLPKALKAYVKAARTRLKCAECGSVVHAAALFRDAGDVCVLLKDVRQAAECYRKSAALFSDVQNYMEGAMTLMHGGRQVEGLEPDVASSLLAGGIDFCRVQVLYTGCNGECIDEVRGIVMDLLSACLKGQKWTTGAAILTRYASLCRVAALQEDYHQTVLGTIGLLLRANEPQRAWDMHQSQEQGEYHDSAEASTARSLFRAIGTGIVGEVEKVIEHHQLATYADGPLTLVVGVLGDCPWEKMRPTFKLLLGKDRQSSSSSNEVEEEEDIFVKWLVSGHGGKEEEEDAYTRCEDIWVG